MKGFIKITSVNENDQYLNIDYIIKFAPINEDYEGNTMIYLNFGEKVSTLQTYSTVIEIAEMIELANK